MRRNILVRVKSVLNLDALGCHGFINDGHAWLANNRLSTLFRRFGVIAAGESIHELAAIVSLEVDSSNISIVKSRSTTNATVILAVRAVKDTATTTCICTTATSSTKSRALVGLSLLGEGAEQVSSRLRGEFVVTETNADLAAGKLETVHLCESILSVRGVNKPKAMLVTIQNHKK